MQESLREVTQGVPRRQWNSIIGNPGDYQADIIFFRYSESPEYKRINNGMTCALVVIEVPSRYAYVAEMPDKSGETVARTMERAIQQALRDGRDGRAIVNLTTDDGTEFNNRVWDKLCRDNHITQWVKEVGDRFSLGIIDRFCRTLKEWIEDWQIENQNLAWVEALPHFFEYYLAAVNRNTGFSPWELRSSDEAQDLARFRDIDRGVSGRKKFTEIKAIVAELGKVGKKQKVRIRYIPADNPRDISSKTHPGHMAKGRQRWSNEVYTIEGIDGYSFSLVDSDGEPAPRDYRAHELLLVGDDSVDVPDVFKRVASQARQKRRLRRL